MSGFLLGTDSFLTERVEFLQSLGLTRGKLCSGSCELLSVPGKNAADYYIHKVGGIHDIRGRGRGPGKGSRCIGRNNVTRDRGIIDCQNSVNKRTISRNGWIIDNLDVSDGAHDFV